MDGRITNIQRFSLQDGPGIRSTVFFAGCNLRCAWCHNPETLSDSPVPLLYPARCIGCGACAPVCPTGAKGETIDRARCIRCGKCAAVCYPQAVCMSEKRMTPEQVLEEVRQDKTYYEYSGGGVTLSGGEALCQPKFAAAVLELCQREKIPAAIETNLLHPFERIRPLLQQTAVLMADIKLIDSAAHQRWTGAENGLILENAVRLGELGIPLIFRTPLIPGATDSPENLRGIAAFVAKIPNVLRYELLNFNPLGADKYTAMGKENAFRQARPFTAVQLAQLRQLLADVPVAVRVG